MSLYSLTSAIQPVGHGQRLPVSEPSQSIDGVLRSSEPKFDDGGDKFQCVPENLKPQFLHNLF